MSPVSLVSFVKRELCCLGNGDDQDIDKNIDDDIVIMTQRV